MNSEDFVGAEEVCHMERGESYGLSRLEYWRIASFAMTCETYGGIEPSTISTLPGEAGCELTLFGKSCCFTITVRPQIGILSVKVLPMDNAEGKPIEVFSGSLSDNDFARASHIILQTDGLKEGLHFMTYDELVEWNRKLNETIEKHSCGPQS